MGLAFLITTDNLRLLSERKVLKGSEYTAMLGAAELIATARKEAERIRTQAARDAEKSRQLGYRDGFNAARAESARRVLSDAQANQMQLLALRDAMAQIVVKGVSQFVGEIDPVVLIERALERVDALIRDEAYLSIRVAPAQEEELRAAITRWREAAELRMTVSVHADPTLAPGECVVQSPSGTLEVGVAAQVDAFRKTIERSGMALP